VLVPPYCGVLSALGMVVARPVADVSQTVVHLGDRLDDARIAAECGKLNLLASERLGDGQTESVEVFADVRFRGQSHELKVRVRRPRTDEIEASFREAYAAQYGRCPEGRAVELVTLRLRRVGAAPELMLPAVEPREGSRRTVRLVVSDGSTVEAAAVERAGLVSRARSGPVRLVDAEATTFVPQGWVARGSEDGGVLLERVWE